MANDPNGDGMVNILNLMYINSDQAAGCGR